MLKLFTYAQSLVAQSYYTLRDREEGQTMAEYAVILAVITVGVGLALLALSGNVQKVIERIGGLIK